MYLCRNVCRFGDLGMLKAQIGQAYPDRMYVVYACMSASPYGCIYVYLHVCVYI